MVGELLSYKMCAFAPRHAASAANRHKGGLGSPPKMLHESSSTKSWQFMAVNHSVYLVLLCYAAGAHESFQKERDPEIMDSFFTTTMFLGRLRQRKKKAPPSRYSLKLQTHISLSINELKVAGVSVAIWLCACSGRKLLVLKL